MSDSYQAVFDATRTSLRNCDVGSAVKDAISGNMDFSHYAARAFESFQSLMNEHNRPSAIYRPTLSLDGDKWVALYGENLQEGVVGTGDSPELAMWDFDKAWGTKATALEAKGSR